MVTPKKDMDSKNSKQLAKIDPIKIPAKELKKEKKIQLDEETSLLESLQIFLRHYGIERSQASIRDVADVSDGPFSYKDAVSALENMEFSANIGKLNIRKLTQGHCPLIVDLMGGQKAVLTKINSKKDYHIYDSEK
jgi:ABC-type bacteriocin/lantibiotic exporters, contain an N-terminal double-glycine peptidase domain